MPRHQLPAPERRREAQHGLWKDNRRRGLDKTEVDNWHLSVGTAVQARLCDVPAVICWMDTPSSPSTFLGLVMGVDV